MSFSLVSFLLFSLIDYPRLFAKFFVIQRPFSPSAVVLLEGTVSQHPLSPAYASPISMTVFTPQSVSQADVVETIQAIWGVCLLSFTHLL